jgi:hypothetical protein
MKKAKNDISEFASEARIDVPVSARVKASRERVRNEARKRVIDRGLVQFRADKEFMECLLQAADDMKAPAGVICREVVWDWLKSRKRAHKNHVKTSVPVPANNENSAVPVDQTGTASRHLAPNQPSSSEDLTMDEILASLNHLASLLTERNKLVQTKQENFEKKKNARL